MITFWFSSECVLCIVYVL